MDIIDFIMGCDYRSQCFLFYHDDKKRETVTSVKKMRVNFQVYFEIWHLNTFFINVALNNILNYIYKRIFLR